MDIRELERVLLDQKEELEALRVKNFCHRTEERQIDLNSNLAQVVIGVRRSGKSTLCFNALETAKVSYAYVNFDDENLYDLTVKDMNDVLQVLYCIYGDFTHLFLDEIQNIEGWHLFVKPGSIREKARPYARDFHRLVHRVCRSPRRIGHKCNLLARYRIDQRRFSGIPFPENRYVKPFG